MKMKVIALQEGAAREDEVVQQVALECGYRALEIHLASGGRANVITTEPCCILVDQELL
jgi:hypothetical protein